MIKKLIILKNQKTFKEFFRFVLIGVLNTTVFYALYLLMLVFFPYVYSYTMAYVVAIGFSYILNSIFTFQTRMTLKKAVIFPFIYLLQFFIGLLSLHLLVNLLSISPKVAGLLSKGVVFPITFILSRLCLKRQDTSKINETKQTF